MAARKTSADRLYDLAIAAAEGAAGGKRAFVVIGGTFREALVAREVLGILFRQDEEVSAERVRELLDDMYIRLTEDERFHTL